MNDLTITEQGEKVKYLPKLPTANGGKHYSQTDKAKHLLRKGERASELFGSSAVLNRDAKAIAIADVMRETYRPENVYTAKDLVNYQTGELFDGHGFLNIGVASRMSPAYRESSSIRARKRAEAKISKHKQLVSQEWRFATFTMPFLKADVEKVLAILSRSVELLKKRKIFRSNVDGAFCGEELTIGDASTDNFTHFHSHIHVLMLGKYIEQNLLAEVWTDCVEKACGEFGVEFSIPNLTTNRLVVDIRNVKKYAKKRSITMQDSLLEVCGYVVKGSDFEKVPVEQLVQIESALRGRQMVKAYGIFNKHKGKGKDINSSKDTYVHNNYTTDGNTHKPTNKRDKPRAKNLLKVGQELIENGKRNEWLKILRLTMQSRREFRRDYLAFKYPHATFSTLDGNEWSGVGKQLNH